MKIKLIDVADYCRTNDVDPRQLRAAILKFMQHGVRDKGPFIGELDPQFKEPTDYYRVNLSAPSLIFNDVHVHYSENKEIEYVEANVRLTDHMPIDFLNSVKISPRLTTTELGELLLVTFDGYPKKDLTVIPQLPIRNYEMAYEVLNLQTYADYRKAVSGAAIAIGRLHRNCLSQQKRFAVCLQRYLNKVNGDQTLKPNWTDEIQLKVSRGIQLRASFVLNGAEYQYYDNLGPFPDCNEETLLIYVASERGGCFLPDARSLDKLIHDLNLLTFEIEQYLVDPTTEEVRIEKLKRRTDQLVGAINRLTEFTNPDNGLTLEEIGTIQKAVSLLESKLPK